jgi:two-component system sensor histidine kinase KdpD
LQRASRLLAHHKVAINLPDDLPLIAGDAVLVEQMLFNLLDNAAKYAPEGTSIQISAAARGAKVAIMIEDEGPGVPDEALETIFDKFARLEAGDRQRAGTGLGLPICRGFATAMGGAIVAGNKAGRRGAVFTLTLPAAPGAPAANVPAREAAHGDA